MLLSYLIIYISLRKLQFQTACKIISERNDTDSKVIVIMLLQLGITLFYMFRYLFNMYFPLTPHYFERLLKRLLYG